MTDCYGARFSGSREGRFGVTTARDDGAVSSKGVYRTPAHKDSGSRQNGWELLRERLKTAMKPEGPRMFVFSNCRWFIRTVPVRPRNEVDMDEVDSRAEDHVGEAGIRLRDGRKKQVPQPLRASLSLRNNGFWNRD